MAFLMPKAFAFTLEVQPSKQYVGTTLLIQANIWSTSSHESWASKGNPLPMPTSPEK